jgi:GH24 family phage-related lysozyme (muramidase)
LKKLLAFLVLIVVLMLSLSINGLSMPHLSGVSDANAQVLDKKPLTRMNANSTTNSISLEGDSTPQYRLLQQKTFTDNPFYTTRDNQTEQSKKHISFQTGKPEPSASIRIIKSSSKELTIQQQAVQCNNFPRNFECTIDANPGETINFQISCFADFPDIIVQCVEVQHIPGSVFIASPPGNPSSATFTWENAGPPGTYIESMKTQIVFCPPKYSFCSDSPLSTLTIKINHPPVADAGPDQSVQSEDNVTLNGASSSDADNDPLTYSWSQISGPSVTLSDPTAANPTFVAPSVDTDTTLTFQLIVNDGKIDSEPDTVTITVNSGGDFSVDCPKDTKVLRGGSAQVKCTVTSSMGFEEPVDLSCESANEPSITCSFDPNPVTPPEDGDVAATLTVNTQRDTPLGSHDLNIDGSSGSIKHSIIVPIECAICFPPRTTAQTTSLAGVNLIEHFEGNAGLLRNTCGPKIHFNCRVTGDTYGLYNDLAGHCTKGIGHLEHLGPCTPRDTNSYNTQFPGGMTHAQALALLAADIATKAEIPVNNLVSVQLTQEQFDALVSFTFNEGGNNLRISNLLRDINSGNCDPNTILADFLRFTRAGGNPDALVARRTTEANLFNNGIY